MQYAVSVIQLGLAVVFAIAGVAKARDGAGTRSAAASFGVPGALTRPVAVALPAVELGIAVALFPAATARIAAGVAVLLLLTFSVAIARVLIRGEVADCHCFGGLSQAPVSRWTLARNAVLAALGVYAAVGAPGESVGALAWLRAIAPDDRPAAIAIIVLGALVVALGVFCLQLLRDNGLLLLAQDGAPGPQIRDAASTRLLPAGAPVPAFTRDDLTGRALSPATLLADGRPLLLLFSDAGCGACVATLERAADAQRERADSLTVAVVIRGDGVRALELAETHGLTAVVHDHDDTVFAACGFGGVPAAMLVGADGRLAAPATIGADDVLARIDAATGDAPTPVLDIQLVGV